MCSSEQPCSITYPRELSVVWDPVTRGGDTVRGTCITSCTQTDNKAPGYTWFINGNTRWHTHQFSTTKSSFDSYSCAVKGHEDLRSPAVCAEGESCWSVNYVSRRVCALQGSTVNISSQYSYPTAHMPKPQVFFTVTKGYVEHRIQNIPRMEYHESINSLTLMIKNVTKSDSAEYTFRFPGDYTQLLFSGRPGVTLTVTDLRVQVTPSAEVTEGQRVTLTCSTSCPLADSSSYIWYHNSRAVSPPESHHKQLLLDPVSRQHAGSYSCAVSTHRDIKSPEETLTVKVTSPVMSAVRLALVCLGLVAVSVCCWWMWRKKTATTEPNKHVQTGQPTDSQYETLAMSPATAAQGEPAEQEDSV
ncbi:sialoadhesin-like [Myripristis murdjan]|uniref:sialoadhesin-like n=1 Tax=Myripristis murdjan TaxID=586833 RepID=UPI0011763364|nr:sialoadhesin-like [Myripristis murdjan]